MRKRFTEEQIIGFLREADAGLTVAELCRRHGFSEASYWTGAVHSQSKTVHYGVVLNSLKAIVYRGLAFGR